MDGIGSRIARKQFFFIFETAEKVWYIIRENEREVIEISQF